MYCITTCCRKSPPSTNCALEPTNFSCRGRTLGTSWPASCTLISTVPNILSPRLYSNFFIQLISYVTFFLKMGLVLSLCGFGRGCVSKYLKHIFSLIQRLLVD